MVMLQGHAIGLRPAGSLRRRLAFAIHSTAATPSTTGSSANAKLAVSTQFNTPVAQSSYPAAAPDEVSSTKRVYRIP